MVVKSYVSLFMHSLHSFFCVDRSPAHLQGGDDLTDKHRFVLVCVIVGRTIWSVGTWKQTPCGCEMPIGMPDSGNPFVGGWTHSNEFMFAFFL